MQLDHFSQAEWLMFLGVALVTPLALRLVLTPDRSGQRSRFQQWIIRLHPVVIVATALALLIPTQPLSAFFACFWLIQSLCISFMGLQRMLTRPVLALEELCIDAGFVYTAISGIWFVAYCAEIRLLSFNSSFVLLTAIHFVYISLGALITAGMVGRRLYNTPRWKTYQRIARVVIIAPLFVAVGITFTQVTGIIFIESLSVLVLASSFVLLALLITSTAPQNTLSRWLLIFATVSLLLTMGFALAYTIGRLSNLWMLSLETMIQWHGWLNALGFVGLSLVAWRLDTPPSHTSPSGIPFSKLPFRWRVGPQFFNDINAVDLEKPTQPQGIVDRMEDYHRDDFDPAQLTPEIVAFYERTAHHHLLVYPQWQRGFHRLGQFYKQMSKRVGQMNFPLEADDAEKDITSQIIPLKDALDGRSHVRGWVRTYTQTQQAVYVAAYSTHTHGAHTYMNIAFPLPFGNLTSILRLDALQDAQNGLALSSFSTRKGDQGVYFANRLCPVRLPINEIIDVYPSGVIPEDYPADFAHGTISARHRMWLFGRHFLTLYYSISPLNKP